eukprot:EG_transcript_16238
MPDYIKPTQMVEAAAVAGATKANLPLIHLCARGVYAGFVLGCAFTLASTVTVQSGSPVVGALVFPCGFILVVLLGLELVTGNLAILPISALARRTAVPRMLVTWLLVWGFNFIGALLYAALFFAVVTQCGGLPDGGPVGQLIIAVARLKTIAYENAGLSGWATCVLKAVLCNWLVCLATVCGLLSTSTLGKVAACWLPVFMFFAQGFEHVVVNMFILPCSMLLGSGLTLQELFLWNILPVTLGNILGAIALVAVPLWTTWSHENLVVHMDEEVPLEKRRASRV